LCEEFFVAIAGDRGTSVGRLDVSIASSSVTTLAFPVSKGKSLGQGGL